MTHEPNTVRTEESPSESVTRLAEGLGVELEEYWSESEKL